MIDFLLKGRVTIHAEPGMKLEIPDGVVIENEVGATHTDLLTLFIWMIVLNQPKCSVCFVSQDIKDPSDF